MKRTHHLLDGIARESVWARVPVAISVKPAIVQRGPADVHFVELGNSAQHLFGSHLGFVAPAAPTDLIISVAGFGQVPALSLQRLRIKMQGFIEVARINRDKPSRGGIRITRLESS